MPFVLPSFNLVCDIYTGAAALFPPALPPGPARVAGQPCALVYGRRVSGQVIAQNVVINNDSYVMHLLLPALVDIRGSANAPNPDFVDCPAGSGRWYKVLIVDDIGKGWPNEHRTAEMGQWPGSWPVPAP